MSCTRSFGAKGKTPEGLTFSTVKQKTSLKGKAGTLVILATGKIYDLPGTSEVWTGTWSILRGTGNYAGLRGGGRWVGAASFNDHSLSARYAGSVTPTS